MLQTPHPPIGSHLRPHACPAPAIQRQSCSPPRKAQQRIVHALEKQIQELETRQTELIAELEKPETYGQPGRALHINRELQDVQERLARLNPEWEQQATHLAGMD